MSRTSPGGGTGGGLRLDGVPGAAAERARPFLEELAREAGERLHSLHLTGSVVTPDWSAERSDVNVLVVLDRTDLKVVEAVAPLGKRYRGKGIAPPLFMDPDYIATSLDVFPMEFLDLKLLHSTVLGEDILAGIEIDRADLRSQCEREAKSRLVGLRQGYLASLGEPKPLREGLLRFLAGFAPLARGVLHLLGSPVPASRAEALAAFAGAAAIDRSVFDRLLALREGRSRPDPAALRELFESCYAATERLGRMVDEHRA